MEKQGAGKKILVVDDNDDSRRLVEKVLGLRGYEVTEVATGCWGQHGYPISLFCPQWRNLFPRP